MQLLANRKLSRRRLVKLYASPGFSSLADHIAMLEAGMQFDWVRVDLDTKLVEGGGRYSNVSPKAYVPALVLDNGELLTENVAILAWIAEQAPQLAPPGPLGRFRLLEMLSFLATEIHKRFAVYASLPGNAQESLANDLRRWLAFASESLHQGYLLGDQFSVADAYLFQLARGALQFEFDVPEGLRHYVERIEQRPAVQEALRREELV
jgi:glutathione S-transferase